MTHKKCYFLWEFYVRDTNLKTSLIPKWRKSSCKFRSIWIPKKKKKNRCHFVSTFQVVFMKLTDLLCNHMKATQTFWTGLPFPKTNCNVYLLRCFIVALLQNLQKCFPTLAWDFVECNFKIKATFSEKITSQMKYVNIDLFATHFELLCKILNINLPWKCYMQLIYLLNCWC